MLLLSPVRWGYINGVLLASKYTSDAVPVLEQMYLIK